MGGSRRMGCQGSKDNKAATAMNRPTPRHEITEAEPAPEGPDLRPDCEHMWYWEEDKDRLDRHHTWDKKGNFVAYPPRVSEYIEAEYQGRKTSMNTALEINYKCYNEHTGFNYRVDFSKMCQINAQSNYERKIMRRRLRGEALIWMRSRVQVEPFSHGLQSTIVWTL